MDVLLMTLATEPLPEGFLKSLKALIESYTKEGAQIEVIELDWRGDLQDVMDLVRPHIEQAGVNRPILADQFSPYLYQILAAYPDHFFLVYSFVKGRLQMTSFHAGRFQVAVQDGTVLKKFPQSRMLAAEREKAIGS